MIKRYLVIISVVGLLFAEYRYSMTDIESFTNSKLPVRISSFHTVTGWGYEIIVDGKTFIHQQYIPAVEGYKSFETSEDALKVGNYLVEKMKNKKHPIITVEELKQLNIKNL
jgi:hypothetical protein